MDSRENELEKKEMTDLVKKLHSYPSSTCKDKDIYDAADALEEQAKEIERLRKYEKMVSFIANDYYEMSYDKAKWQRDDWKKRCDKLIREDILQSDAHLIGDSEF
jgi:hypothetical protein